MQDKTIIQYFEKTQKEVEELKNMVNWMAGQVFDRMAKLEKELQSNVVALDTGMDAICHKISYSMEEFSKDTNMLLEKKEEELDRARGMMKSEGPLAMGDTARITYAGTLDGVPFAGGTTVEPTEPFVMNGKTFIPGFEDQIVGMMLNETKKIKVTFPITYQQKELAGKDVEFEVKLHSLKKPIPKPEVVPEEKVEAIEVVAEEVK
jgi:FKBP-type peptidyl-prolyl cis-trans isomerase (trigger factor)